MHCVCCITVDDDCLVILPSPSPSQMTAGEWKFALQVESVLNTLQDPEYRQLVVEALMLVALVVQHDREQGLGQVLVVDHLIADANRVFLVDQVSYSLSLHHMMELHSVTLC